MGPSVRKRQSAHLTRLCVLALSLSSLANAHGRHSQKPFRKTGGEFTSLFESAASRQQPFTKSTLAKVLAAAGPGDEWEDNVWPYRQPTPWDISTDLPHPRKLQYDVKEGTWLRLDVHPSTGDIIFDMVGDLYCLPGSAINSRGATTKALPVLTGVPHDTAPRFSPNGDRVVFTSDAELGVENIWVIPWKGCQQNHAKRAEANSTAVEEGKEQLAQGVKETAEQRQMRLVSEGRNGAQRVTNETFRWVNGARFHPSGSKVIATKWYTSDRSLGAGEGWQYNVPTLGSSDPISPGSGNRVTGRTLPLGWTVDDYGSQQIGPEQHLWYGSDALIYAKNVGDESTYTYSKDIHKGIYSIFKVNITNGDQETLVDASPGGASRPELSRDQRTLAFVRRVRDKQALVFKDLQTGSLTHIWHGLSYDVSSSWAPMAPYPSFAFTPKDDAVIIWASGQIYRVPLTTNDAGEKIAAKESPQPVKFTAHIDLDLAEVRKEKFNLLASETAETNRVLAFKELSVDDAGHRAVFQAAGKSYYKDIGSNETLAVPALFDAPYVTPTFAPGSNGTLVTHARWDDLKLSIFELARLDTKEAVELTGLPLGRYFSPVLSGASGNVRIAWVKHDGDGISGAIIATSQPGLYVGNINIGASGNSSIAITNVRYVPSQIRTGDRVYLRWVSQTSLLIQQSSSSFTIDVDAGQESSVLRARLGSELVVSDPTKTNVAFVELFHVYFAKGADLGDGEAVWAKPGNATKGLTRLSVIGGHDLAWNADGSQLFWFIGPSLNRVEVARLSECTSEIEQDKLTFGIACVSKLVSSEDVVVEHSTDIARLKKDAKGKDTLVFFNANIIPMGSPNAKVIRNGVIISKGGVITDVGTAGAVGAALSNAKSQGAKLIDAKGAYIVPGFLDVHAHWDGAFGATRFPARSWELETFLAYGVTTVQNPSADNVDTFWERSRLERGQFVGSRIFSVGDIIYGAGGDVHQEIVDMDQAYEALTRIRAEGGIGAIAYKNYNLPSRAARQRLLLAARNVSILCVPEGGMNWDWDFTYWTDGMTTQEHSFPIPQLYDDVLTLIAKSGTAITPTHLVHYGGAFGEQYLWSHEDLAANEKLRKFTPHDILASITESTARPAYSWTLFNTTLSMAKAIQKGGRALIGAHGEPPLGRGYHEELFFAKSGGLTNYEVLLAATSNAAETFGLDGSVGSLVKGKLADLVVFQPGVDILNGDITNTQKISYVVRGGRVWKADTMEEVWPVEGRKQVMPIINPE